MVETCQWIGAQPEEEEEVARQVSHEGGSALSRGPCMARGHNPQPALLA